LLKRKSESRIKKKKMPCSSDWLLNSRFPAVIKYQIFLDRFKKIEVRGQILYESVLWYSDIRFSVGNAMLKINEKTGRRTGPWRKGRAEAENF
jgi:hypothetical protein